MRVPTEAEVRADPLGARHGQYTVASVGLDQMDPWTVLVLDRARERRPAVFDLRAMHSTTPQTREAPLPTVHEPDGTISQLYLRWRRLMIRMVILEHYWPAIVRR